MKIFLKYKDWLTLTRGKIEPKVGDNLCTSVCKFKLSKLQLKDMLEDEEDLNHTINCNFVEVELDDLIQKETKKWNYKIKLKNYLITILNCILLKENLRNI